MKKTFDLETFKAWMAKQPEERSFDFLNCRECLFASFGKEALGFPETATAGAFAIDPHWPSIDGRVTIPQSLAAAASRACPLTIGNFRAQLPVNWESKV